MTSSERVKQHRQKQKEAGKVQVSLYLDHETATLLRSHKPESKGEIVSRALKALIGANR